MKKATKFELCNVAMNASLLKLEKEENK